MICVIQIIDSHFMIHSGQIRADIFLICTRYDLPGTQLMLPRGSQHNLHDLIYHMFRGLDLYRADPAKHLRTAG